MPCRMACAWEFTPPPATLTTTRNLLTVSLMRKASLMVCCQGAQLKTSSIGLPLTKTGPPLSRYRRTLAMEVLRLPVP